MLHIIGLGLGNEKDITLNALDAIKKCNKVYLESYTSILKCDVSDLEKLYGKEIILADRDMVEKNAESTILKDALENDIAFLVVGDVFGATTHTDIILRAKNKGITLKYYYNASIMNAIGVTGLELYKFGKTTSMVFFDDNWKPTTAYDVVYMNKNNGLHTLVLLDIKTAEPSKEDIMKDSHLKKALPPRFMTIKECLEQFILLEKEKKQRLFNENVKVIGCARIGSDDFVVKYGTIKDLISFDFGGPLHSIIIPGKLHFMEEDFLNSYN
jgi:diphthine methyl ester synthase